MNSSMKRVALLFCGRVRAHEHCHSTFQKHIVTPLREAGYEYDSFLSHSSATVDQNTQAFIDNNKVVSYEMVIPDNSHLESIPLHEWKTSTRRSFLMYYHWKNAFRLMEAYAEQHGIRYDVVIYMRADQYFSSNLEIPGTICKNTVYIPHGSDWTGLNDQFAMGDIDSMKIYTALYDNIRRLYEKTRIGFHTETYVLLYMQDVNMNIQRFALTYELHRARF